MTHIPFVQIKAGDNSEFGLLLGKKLKRQIQKRVSDNKRLYYKIERLKSFPVLIRTAEKFLPALKRRCPELLAELKAMGIGAQVPFDHLLVLMCEEELLDFRIPHCTNVAIKTGRGPVLGHNEDWSPAYKNNGLFLVKGNIKGEKFLALSYLGGLAGTSCGLNEEFCFTANSMDTRRFRYGIPVKFQMRSLLTAHSPRAAKNIDLTDSSIASNMVYAWKDSKILDIEDYFGHHEEFYGGKFLVHTNHPVLKKDRTRANTEAESIRRYSRAQEILANCQKYNIQVLKKILSDHACGICAHPQRRHSAYGITIASVIMNPREKSLSVCWSNPCRHPFKKYKL